MLRDQIGRISPLALVVDPLIPFDQNARRRTISTIFPSIVFSPMR